MMFCLFICRHHEGSSDTEERDNPRPGLLGDGPAPSHRPPPSYDDNDDYYYDNTEPAQDADADDDDDDGGRDVADNATQPAAAADIGEMN